MRIGILTTIATAIAIGAAVIPGGGGGGGPGGVTVANIWLVASGAGNCTRSATQVSFATWTTHSCGTIDAANDICQGDDLVGIKGGDYGTGTKSTSGSGSGRSVGHVCTMGSAQGEVATIGSGTNTGQTNAIDIGVGTTTSFLTLDGDYGGSCLNTSCMGIWTHTYTDGSGGQVLSTVGDERGDDYISYLHIHAGNVTTAAGHAVVAYSDLGPSTDPQNSRQNTDGTVWKDNFFHDQQVTNGGHYECLTWDGGDNVTIRRNIFKNCGILGVLNKPQPSVCNGTEQAVTGGTFTNNAFWNPTGQATDDLSTTSDACAQPNTQVHCNVTVSNNWFSNGWIQDCGGSETDGGGNTSHSQSVQPPDPRLDPDP